MEHNPNNTETIRPAGNDRDFQREMFRFIAKMPTEILEKLVRESERYRSMVNDADLQRAVEGLAEQVRGIRMELAELREKVNHRDPEPGDFIDPAELPDWNEEIKEDTPNV